MTQLRTIPDAPVVTHTPPPASVLCALVSALIAATGPIAFTGGVTLMLGFGLLAHLLFLLAALRPRPKANPMDLSGITGVLLWTVSLMCLTIGDAGVMLPVFVAAALAILALALALARWSPLGALAAVLLVGCDALVLDHLTGDGLGLPGQILLAAAAGFPALALAAFTLSRRRRRKPVHDLARGA